MRKSIFTSDAPAPIGAYSQAVQVDGMVYLSGQIPLLPETGELIRGDIAEQIRQVFRNIAAVAAAAGGTLQDVVKLTVFLVDLADFAAVNQVMAEYFEAPFPARAVVGVASLPKGAGIEIEALMVLGH